MVCVCAKMRFGLKQADFSSLASTKPNELVAWTGVVSHQLRHISVKKNSNIKIISSLLGKWTFGMVLEKDGNSFGIKMVPSILISLPCSPVMLIKAEKVKIWTILSVQ